MSTVPDDRRNGSMDATGVPVLGRRLKRLGGVLLIGALAAFVWAVGFSRGVDGLLEGLVIAVAGFLVPAVALLWIGWVLADATQDRDFGMPAERARELAQGRGRLTSMLQSYLIAIAAVALATMIRSWLTPYMGDAMLSPTFLLAVTVSAWVGGMGPAVLATLVSIPVLWYVFLLPGGNGQLSGQTGMIVGLALFVTVALSIAGIASALRLTQSRSALLRADVRAREAALDESEARFREMADEAPAMIWMTDADGKCTYFNRTWLEFTGRRLEDELGEGWASGVHEQDARRRINTFRNAVQRREPMRTEYRLRRHDGTYRRVIDQAHPRIDRDGRFVGFIGACVDVQGPPEQRGAQAPALGGTGGLG
jgi:PAS domain S-box-containing protein